MPEVGYKKPPASSQFKKGVCPNPRGRGAAKGDPNSTIDDLFNETVNYFEGGRARRASRLEVTVRSQIARALKGDVGSADAILKLRAHAQKHGDVAPRVIRIINALPDWDDEDVGRTVDS